MKALIIPVIALAFLPAESAVAQQKIEASMLLLAANSNTQISSVKVGRSFRVRLTGKNLNLIANRDTTFTYTLSILPNGSSTPVSMSGKLSGVATLPKSLGGAAKTTKEMASLKGTQTDTFLVTVPDFMPAGTANLTLSLAVKGAGAVTLDRKLTIRL